MPVALSYPGVYIEEIPSGVHTLREGIQKQFPYSCRL